METSKENKYQIVSSDIEIIAQGEKEILTSYAERLEIDLTEEALLMKIPYTEPLEVNKLVFNVEDVPQTVGEIIENYKYLDSKVKFLSKYKKNTLHILKEFCISASDENQLKSTIEIIDRLIQNINKTLEDYKVFLHNTNSDIYQHISKSLKIS